MKQHCIICAIPRSGGSLLGRLLDGHEDVGSFPTQVQFGNAHLEEAGKSAENFSEPIQGSIKSVMQKHDRYERIHRMILGKHMVKGEYPEFDIDYFEESMEKKVPDNCEPKIFREMFAEVFLQSHQYYRGRWEELQLLVWHNTYMSYWLEDLIKRDQTKVILLFRHPLDSISSTIKTFGNKRDYQNEVLAWRDHFVFAHYYKQKYPDMVHILRYEDIVNDLENQMTILSEFLNIPFNETLLQPSLFGEPWQGISNFGITQKVSKDAVGRFKTFLDEEKMAYTLDKLEKHMPKLGYIVDEPYFLEKYNNSFDFDYDQEMQRITRDYFFRSLNNYSYIRAYKQYRTLVDWVPAPLKAGIKRIWARN